MNDREPNYYRLARLIYEKDGELYSGIAFYVNGEIHCATTFDNPSMNEFLAERLVEYGAVGNVEMAFSDLEVLAWIKVVQFRVFDQTCNWMNQFGEWY